MVEIIDALIPSIAILVAVVAAIFLVGGIDDLAMNLVYLVWRVYQRLFSRRDHKPLTREMLMETPQRPIALMIPAWQEAPVIRRTLLHAIEHIFYYDYVIFVGLYPNDPETRAEVEAVARMHPGKLRIVDVASDGPTTKADCLNAIIETAQSSKAERGANFEIFVLHDAEDVIPRYGLLLFNHLMPERDFIQLPVFPAKVRWYQFTPGHYMDEFAQLHIRDMPIREWMTGAIPSAGVGAAFSRKALELAARVNHGRYFTEGALTEDYELPLQLTRHGAREVFIAPGERISNRQPALDDDLVMELEEYPYVRSQFPDELGAAVRQKSRWVVGISLQGWEHLGWSGSPSHRFMLWRDRKVLISNIANFSAYLLVLLVAGLWLLRWLGSGDPAFPNVVEPGGLVWKLLIVNFVVMLMFLAVRFACTLSIYGPVHAIFSGPRAVWGNYINFLATLRALTHVLPVESRRQGTDPLGKDGA